MCEQQLIEYDSIPNKAIPKDNRKIGVAFVCFEDQQINFSSNLKFSTTTKNWRNLQCELKLGDYGGSFKPESVLYSLEEFEYRVNILALNDSRGIDEIIFSNFNITNGTIIINKLRHISQAALYIGTNVRVMTAEFICGGDSLDIQ